MLPRVFTAALLSAFLNAAWNAAAKNREKPSDAVLGIIFASTLLCAALLLVIGPPPFATWIWVLFAAPLNALSVTLMRVAYDWTEYGLAYPLARGIIPLVLIIIGWFLDETLSPMALSGMAIVVIAFVLFAIKAKRLGSRNATGLGLAALAGIALALGLFCDRNGARMTDINRTYGIDYAIMTGLLSGLLIAVIGQIQARRKELPAFQRGNTLKFVFAALMVGVRFEEPMRIFKRDTLFCFLGGFVQIASFVIGLWAYAQGPLSLVAALRETNILFAGLLSWIYLRERIAAYQWFAIGLTALGAVLVKVG
jgi:drug/metabolite transporter (DMT)-like permease